MSERWRIDNIGNLAGKVAIVTGANTGLGYDTARELAAHGAHVVLASRNLDKANAAQRRMSERHANLSTEVQQLDLASLTSVAAFAEEFTARHDQLDLLINNAGIMMVPQGITEDGFEQQLGTNHLGHFALTGHLIDVLGSTSGARVVTVSSLAHRSATMDFDNLMFERGYTAQAAHGRSKLANLLFALELDRRCQSHGLALSSLAAHPGVSATDLGNHLMRNVFLQPLKLVAKVALQTPAAGAEPTLRAATDPAAKGGDYFGPAGWGEVRGRPIRVRATAAARDEASAARLWDVSEELTGIRFP